MLTYCMYVTGDDKNSIAYPCLVVMLCARFLSWKLSALDNGDTDRVASEIYRTVDITLY